ncbi:hypothetical protein ACFFRR_005502 [Megaselia abdita]
MKMIISDQGSTNRALYSYFYIKGFEVDTYDFLEDKRIGLNGSYKQKFIPSLISEEAKKALFSAQYGESELPLVYDYCHLMKSFGNTLLNYDFITPDGLVSFKVYEEIWKYDCNKATKICPKLTKEHIYPQTVSRKCL